MKVLLVSVITEDIFMTVLPLGPAYVGAAAGNAGHDVKMLSLRSAESNFLEILKKEVDRILDKINSQGFGALTDSEKKILDEAGDLLKKR